MSTPILYRIGRSMVRAVAAVYFRKLEISGRRHVAQSGPLIVAANHPQSITDALILGLATGRMLNYLAHSGLFRNRWQAALLSSCGVIPVYRAHEVADAVDRNVAMFAACYRVLEQGAAIGIFPEGTSAEERRVQKLKTGAARIALQCEALNEWKLGLAVVPAGINFQSHGRFRSRVLVSFGSPIRVADFRLEYAADPVEAVHSLTELLEKKIRAKVIEISSDEFAQLIADVERVYKGELIDRGEKSVPGGTRFKREQNIAKEIPRALDFFLRSNPDIVWSIREQLGAYMDRLRQFRLSDEEVSSETPSVIGASTRLAVLGAIGLPPAAWGLLWNYLPYRATGLLAARGGADPTKMHFRHIALGTPIYLLYYLPLFYLAYRMAGPLAAGLFALSLGPAGLFARAYLRHMGRRRKLLRLARLRLTQRVQLKQMRQQRRNLIVEMDDALALYLAALGSGRGDN